METQPLPNLADLHARAQQNRVDFLKTDLDLCFTFTDLVGTELKIGDLEAAQQLRDKAEHGYQTIARLLLGVDECPDKDLIQQRLNELRVRLESLSTHL